MGNMKEAVISLKGLKKDFRDYRDLAEEYLKERERLLSGFIVIGVYCGF